MVKARKSEIIKTMEAKGNDDAMSDVQEAIMDYSDRMKRQYPDLWEKVEAFHALIGSGLQQGMKTTPDFPEAKDSVMTFLESLNKDTV